MGGRYGVQARGPGARHRRQFPSKRELLAALVTRRLEQIADAAREAYAREGAAERRWPMIGC